MVTNCRVTPDKLRSRRLMIQPHLSKSGGDDDSDHCHHQKENKKIIISMVIFFLNFIFMFLTPKAFSVRV